MARRAWLMVGGWVMLRGREVEVEVKVKPALDLGVGTYLRGSWWGRSHRPNPRRAGVGGFHQYRRRRAADCANQSPPRLFCSKLPS